MNPTAITAAMCGLSPTVLQRLPMCSGPTILLVTSEFDFKQILLDESGREVSDWLGSAIGSGYAKGPVIGCAQTEIYDGRRGYAVALAISKRRINAEGGRDDKLLGPTQFALREALDGSVTNVLGPDGCYEADPDKLGHRLLIAAVVYHLPGKHSKDNGFAARFFSALEERVENFRLSDINRGEQAVRNAPGWYVAGKWGTADGK